MSKHQPKQHNQLFALVFLAGTAAVFVYPHWAAVTRTAADQQQQRQLLHVSSEQQHIKCPWGDLKAPKDAWTPTLLPEPKLRTELLSFPGSGNSWVRHLIETSTGYRTNSIYHCNKKNYPPEIAADCNRWNSSIVTKNHNFECTANWDKAIVLLRNPLHAIRAEYQRAKTWNQTAVIAEHNWDWSDWYKVVDRKCRKWKADHAQVLGLPLGDASGPVTSTSGCAVRNNRTLHLFFYEDFKTPSEELNVQFLHQLLAVLGIKKHDAFLECAMALSDGEYHRSYPTDPRHPAVQALTDVNTLNIIQASGCMDAYKNYRQQHLGRKVVS